MICYSVFKDQCPQLKVATGISPVKRNIIIYSLCLLLSSCFYARSLAFLLDRFGSPLRRESDKIE